MVEGRKRKSKSQQQRMRNEKKIIGREKEEEAGGQRNLTIRSSAVNPHCFSMRIRIRIQLFRSQCGSGSR
jgi:hypothetical protein